MAQDNFVEFGFRTYTYMEGQNSSQFATVLEGQWMLQLEWLDVLIWLHSFYLPIQIPPRARKVKIVRDEIIGK